EAGDGWVADFAETVQRQLFARLDLQLGEFEGGTGVDDGGVFDAGFVTVLANIQRPAGGLSETSDGGAEVNGIAESLAQGIGEDLQALVEGKFWGAIFGDVTAAFAFPRAENLAFDERTVFGFELSEFGEGL